MGIELSQMGRPIRVTHAIIVPSLIVFVAVMGCGPDTAEEQLESELEDADIVFHTGCDQSGLCTEASRRCHVGPAQIVAYHAEHGSAAIEWFPPPQTFSGRSSCYWFVDRDGGGRYYEGSFDDSDSSTTVRVRVDGPGAIIGDELYLYIGVPPPGVDAELSRVTDLDRCGWPDGF